MLTFTAKELMKKEDLWCQYSDLPSPLFYNSDMKKEDIKIGNFLYYENTTHIVSGLNDDYIYSWWIKEGKPVIEWKENGEKNPYIDIISHYEPITLTESFIDESSLLMFKFIFDSTVDVNKANHHIGGPVWMDWTILYNCKNAILSASSFSFWPIWREMYPQKEEILVV